MTELIIDSFAGGGGASLGIEMALGRSPDYAINHDEKALAMHQANHPDTVHLSKNIWKIDPMDVVGRSPVGLLWASPDCKHFSKAKGGKPVKRNIRDLAWVVVLWAKRARPRVIMLENVEEFQDWGPVTLDGKPCKDRKGETFAEWVKQLKRLGYKVEWRELRACDYGAPTIRKRLFVIARRDGQPIVWPEPTHGAPDSEGVREGHLLPWRTAAEIIDWSLPCPSIFDTAEEIKKLYGIRAKRPLADATLRRIARGIVKFVLAAKRPFIVVCNHSGDSFRGQSADEPVQTMTASRDAFGLVAPHITKFRNGSTGHAIHEPLATVTANGESKRPGGAVPLGVVAPVLTYGQQGGGNRPIDEPHHTVTASRKDTNAVIAPTLVQTGYGEREGQAPRVPGLDKPVGTQVAGASKHAVVAPVLTGCGGRAGQSPPRSADSPVGTMTAKPDQVVAAAHLSSFYGEGNGGKDRGTDPAKPGLTDTAGGNRHAVVAAFLAQHNAGPRPGQQSKPADAPMSTVTTTGAQQGVVAAHMMTMRGSERRGASCDDPLNTLSAGGQHAALVAAFMDTYYGTDQTPAMDGPMPTETTRDRRSLVTVDIDGETFVITDIGLRMLTPRERFRAQGFHDGYIIDHGILPDGSTIPLTQEVQGRCCGNSVCPPLAQALVEANCADLAEIMEAAE